MKCPGARHCHPIPPRHCHARSTHAARCFPHPEAALTLRGCAAGIYKGFSAQWLRVGPHTTISLVVWEYLRRISGLHAI